MTFIIIITVIIKKSLLNNNYNFRNDRVGRLVRERLRNRAQGVTQESSEGHNRDANKQLEAIQIPIVHEDVRTLSDDVSISLINVI